MDYINPYKAPEFIRIIKKYKALKKPYKQVLSEFERIRESIWHSSIEYKLISKLDKLPHIKPHIAFFGVIFLLIFAKGNSLIGFLILFVFLAYILILKIKDNVRGSAKTRVSKRHNLQLLQYENVVEEASSILNILNKDYASEWESACERYRGYPPDWNDRCIKVKSRDGNKCTNCGYPDGFQRRSRELHVHHNIALSDGGDNSLDNLVTLCHMCHRKVDKKHAWVSKTKKRRSK